MSISRRMISRSSPVANTASTEEDVIVSSAPYTNLAKSDVEM